MPRLQDIERFKRDLAALSHEAEVLERWGEKPESIVPPEGAAVAPETPAAEESAAPKAGPKKAAAPKAPKREAPEAEEGAPPDFAALLDGLPLDEEGEAESEGESGPSLDDELAALLGPSAGETAADEGLPLEEAPLEETPLEEMPLEEASLEEAPAVEAEAESPETESADFDFAMPEFEAEAAGAADQAEAPAEAAEGIAVGGAEPAEEELEPLQELGAEEEAPAAPIDDFAMPDFDLGGESLEEAPKAEAAEGPAAPPSADDFSIPDFGAPEKESAAEFGGSLDLGAGLEEMGEAEAAPPSFGAPPIGEAAGDAFETFSFEEPGAPSGTGFGADSFGADAFGAGRSRDLDTEIASLSEEAPVADTFKLDQDWGGFGSFGAEESKEGPKGPAPAKPSRGAKAAQAGQAEEKFKPVSLSEAQVDRLQDSLLALPLNLRVAVEDILANDKGSEAQASKLVWALVEGVSADELAILAGRILKRHIPIPKGYEKRTGASLEAEKGTLAYALIHTFLPVIKIGLFVLAAAAAVGYLGWRFVYVPLAADSLYRIGYQRIAEDRYPEADVDFEKATAMKEFVAWYYRYAEAYAAKRQYILAEKKYAALVEAHPKETKGILAWARLEKDQLKYEEAVDVLKGASPLVKGEAARGKTGLLSWDYFNEEGLLLLGDVYLDWADEEKSKFEDARRTYATLLEHYGDKDAYLERMLLYFIRVDKIKEVLPLKARFLADPLVNPLSAPVLSELGGYLIDKGMLEGVREMLLAAAKKDPSVPEAHYNLARYFRLAGAPTEERKALDNAVSSFAALPGLGARRAGMYIDSLIWRGRFLVEAKEWLGAEGDYAAAATEYEKALELRRVTRSGRFGEAYAGLGDVAYWQRDDLPSALALYERAEANGYATQETSYKRGNMLYRTGRYAESIEQLYKAGAEGPMSPNLSYAFGSALYARSDLFAAEAYYRKAAAAMEKLLENGGEPLPQEEPSKVEILKLYLKSENNLGVALYRSAARSGDARRRNEAMAVLTRSIKLYDQLSQAPSALEGPEGRNLALANMNTLLQGGKADKLLVYTEIEKDMKFPRKE